MSDDFADFESHQNIHVNVYGPAQKSKRFQLTCNVRRFLQQPSKFAGKNTLFGRHNASFFLLNYNVTKKLKVVTNNENFKKFTFNPDRRNPNRNYIITNFINGVFRFFNFHKKYSSELRSKYFKIVRRHLLEQYEAVRCRLDSPTTCSNNNQTRTYFRFSIASQVIYFGFYPPCVSSKCNAPPTFVTKHGSHCWSHWKTFCQERTPVPPIHRHEMSNVPKRITSHRLGITYTKEMSFSEKRNKYFVVYKDLKRLPDASRHQTVRFDRLTGSPKSNDYKKLVTFDKEKAVIFCKHQPTSNISLSPVIEFHIALAQPDDSVPPPPPSLQDLGPMPDASPLSARKIRWSQKVNYVLQSASDPSIATPPPPPDESSNARPWLPTPEPQVRTFEEPAEWHNDAAPEPIYEELPFPEGFQRRHPKK